MSARIVIASSWRITSGGCHRGMVKATTERRNSVAGGSQREEANAIGERPTGYW